MERREEKFLEIQFLWKVTQLLEKKNRVADDIFSNDFRLIPFSRFGENSSGKIETPAIYLRSKFQTTYLAFK